MGGLDALFTELIAKDYGIKPEEVTPQFILEQREKFIYPYVKLPAPIGMVILSKNEMKELEELSDEILELN